MTIYGDELLITFGFQDNAAFILKGALKIFEKFIGIEIPERKIEKLTDFAPVYCISFEDDVKRREVLQEQFDQHGVTCSYIVSTKEDDKANKVTGKYIDSLSPRSVNVVVSHLKAIRHWVNESNSPYAIFVEDDVSLKTVDYWNFSWTEFMKTLPEDWDCVQLGCINAQISDLRLRKREGDIWSAMAYMLRRDYAKHLISLYCPNGSFNLEIPDSNIQPHIENLLYHTGNTYFIPALVENIDFKTTLDDRADVEKHEEVHINSHDSIMELWKNEGYGRY
jgi:hypothetical protein